MKGRGEHETKLIPADGEHGSAGICYGASLMGASALFFFALACRRCDMTHNDGDAAHSIMETTDGS
ncbi:hypothetical protein ABEH82_11125 [Geobacillus thermoleovorans]